VLMIRSLRIPASIAAAIAKSRKLKSTGACCVAAQ
jgi:hypothetical protein